jgi:hypothetical protein
MGQPPHRPEPHDQVQFGSSRRRPWLAGLGLAAITIAAITIVAVRSGAGGHGHHPTSARTGITVVRVGHPILAEPTGWDLFARGDGFVADIQLAWGRVRQTVVPPLNSGNAVSFLVAPHEVIVRSYDYVPGYVVPDGRPPHVLTGLLATGGPLLPGPAPGEVWTQTGTSQNLALVSLAGRRIGPSISFPQGRAQQLSATADGRGYVLAMTGSGALVDQGPTWRRPVRFVVAAIGPTGWFGQQCRGRHSCRNVVMNPVTGALRLLPGLARRSPYLFSPPGVIAPDGSYAAVYEGQPNGQFHVVLVNLATGARTRLPMRPGTPDPGSMAWSPDCQWLFVAWNGKLLAVSATSANVTTLRLGLPPVSQVAVRQDVSWPPSG